MTMTSEIEQRAGTQSDTASSPHPRWDRHHLPLHASKKTLSPRDFRRREFDPPAPHPQGHDVAESGCAEGKARDDGALCPDLLSLDSDDDCKSFSSYGSSSSYSERSIDRRVSFAPILVTEVKTRPYTNDSEKRLLFYTQSETDRFRQIYREERKSISLNNVGNTGADPSSSDGSRHRHISRVVVEHKDCLETFYAFDGITSLTTQDGDNVFFDNESFWNGSITWY